MHYALHCRQKKSREISPGDRGRSDPSGSRAMYRYRDIAIARAPLHRRVLNLSKYSRFPARTPLRARALYREYAARDTLQRNPVK
jgi:hypothetical protein